MVRHDAADGVRHRRLDPQPIPAEHGHRLAFGRQQPLPVIQADGVDADFRSLAEQAAEQLADPGRDRSRREPSTTTTMPGPHPTPR